MTRLTVTAIAFTFITLGSASCGGNGAAKQDAQAAPTAAPTQPFEITFRTEPDPPKSGETTLEATVKGAHGQPVTDAQVSAEFYMAPMLEMKMPEMRNTILLPHAGGGQYRGKGNIMMAGRWDVAVTVKRDGQEVGKRTIAVTAR